MTLMDAPEDTPDLELAPGNIAELGRAIDNMKDPKRRAVLEAEMQRLREMAGNLWPIAPKEPEQSDIRRLPLELPANYQQFRENRSYSDAPRPPMPAPGFLPGAVPGVNGMPVPNQHPALMYPNVQGVIRG